VSSDDCAIWLAIFVGGKSTRMGGRPKGLIPIDVAGTSIVAHQIDLATRLLLPVVLVGDADPYSLRFPELRVIADAPAGIGPLGGLSGLLRARGTGSVIALACDMPHLTISLLARLLHEAPEAAVLASRDAAGRWDPLCARYDASAALPVLADALADGVRSFQGLFARLAPTEFVLSALERTQLVDWDTPTDLGPR